MQRIKSFSTMIDGRPASAIDLAPLAFAGFAHFTAMQIRDRAVRGLDLHIERLRSSSLEMFGVAHSADDLKTFLSAAINEGPADVSLTATIFSRSGEFSAGGASDDPAILVRTGLPATGPIGPMRLDVVQHHRPLPTIKHVGEATKTYYLRKAVAKGFDDAAYVNKDGHLSEATIWNFAFWDGTTVIWPKAEFLSGITMQIVKRQLAEMDIPQCHKSLRPEDITRLSGSVVMNSWTPAIPVSAIGLHQVAASQNFTQLLHRAYQMEAPVEI